MRRVSVVFVLALALVPAHLAALPDPVEERIEEVAKLISEKPTGVEELFTKDFLKAVPAAQIVALCQDIHKKNGPVVSVKKLSSAGVTGRYELTMKDGTRQEANIALEPNPPHKIIGLFLKPLGARYENLDGAVAALKKLPGKVSFAAARLGPGAPSFLGSLNPDESLAIGSAFKLYILGALAEDVTLGKRKWQDVAVLHSERFSLPSGTLQTWPDKSPMTLHSLATFMISISDNTATDALLLEVGRSRVERQLEVMGNRTPSRTIPFLATSEMFRLKWGKPYLGDRYAQGDLAVRREILEKDLARVPLGSISEMEPDEPKLIDKIEWFASAGDLVRAMDWLKKLSSKPEAEPLRGVLAVNPGTSVHGWKYVGYKGGSEPGVLQLVWLLERNDGEWFVLSLGWNDPSDAVDLNRLVGIGGSILELLAKAPTRKLY